MEDTEIFSLNQILKAGSVVATDVALGGTLTPKQGRAFANAIKDNSALLKAITVDVAGKLTKNRTAIEGLRGQLARHIAGKAVSEANLKKLGVVGAKLNMVNGVVYQLNLTDEVLDDNQDNPGFADEQYNAATMVFSNDLVYLGWVGTDDNDLETAPFAELAKGWLTVAAESANTVKATYAAVANDAYATVKAALQAVVDNADEDVSDNLTIYLSKKDYNAYVRGVAGEFRALEILKSGELLEFEGRKLSPQIGIPKGVYLGSPEKNLVMGISTQIDRKRWYSNEISSLCYKFVVRPDYEFDIHKYVTIVTEAVAP